MKLESCRSFKIKQVNLNNEWSIETREGIRIGGILENETDDGIELFIHRNSHEIVFALELDRSERNVINFLVPRGDMQDGANGLTPVGHLTRQARLFKYGYAFHAPLDVNFGEIKESFIARNVRICRYEREIAVIKKTIETIHAEMDSRLGRLDCIFVLGIAIAITILFPRLDATTKEIDSIPFILVS
nr:hypothetical protein [Candidatus Sigynarchaeota archaeon]